MLHIDDNISLIKNIVDDTAETDKLLQCLENDAESSHPLLLAFSGKERFSIIFDEWVRNQARPFLGFKPLDESSSAPAVRPTLQTHAPPQDSITQAPAKSKKPKRRVTPVTIASSLPPSLNISSSTSFPKLSNPSIFSSAEQWPALGATGAAQHTTKGRWQNTGPSLDKNPESTSLSVSNITPPPSRVHQALPTVVSTSQDTKEDVPPQPPLPALSRHISTSVKAQLDHCGVTVRVLETPAGTTPVLSSPGVSDLSPPCPPCPPPDNREEGRDGTSARKSSSCNLARIYSSLVMEQLLPLVPAFILLCRLLAARITYTSLGKDIYVDVEDTLKFPSCLFNDEDLVCFACTTARSLLCCTRALGDDVNTAYAGLLEGLDPSLAASVRANVSTAPRQGRSDSLTGAEEDIAGTVERDQSMGNIVRQANDSEGAEAGDVETFIRSFHDEMDSRNEYRTQASAVLLWAPCCE